MVAGRPMSLKGQSALTCVDSQVALTWAVVALKERRDAQMALRCIMLARFYMRELAGSIEHGDGSKEGVR